MWSQSHRRADLVHQGKTQVRSRTAMSSACRSGTTGESTGSWVSGFHGSSTGSHGDRPGGAAPLADLAGGDRGLAALQDGRQAVETQRVLGEVDVAGRPSARLRGFETGAERPPQPPTPRSGRGRSGLGRARRRPWRGGRRASRRSRAGGAGAAMPVMASSRSRASARSRTPWISLVPSKETCCRSMVKCRSSNLARRRCSTSSGMNRAVASSTSRVSWTGPSSCATGAACRSTNAAASGERVIVFSATRRARHAGKPPLDHPSPRPRAAGAGAPAPGRRSASRTPWTVRWRRRTR